MNERELFSAALAIHDPRGRADFLDDACTGDANLRRRVETLLQAHYAAESFLGTPPIEQFFESASGFAGPAGPRPAADAGSESTHPISDEVELYGGHWLKSILSPSTAAGSMGRLGHYEVEAVLGQGGFGTVLRAFDERLHRTVAIKLLSPELATTSPPRKRFLREARAAAAIRHSNVVAIHAVEDTPLPYLVMEYVPGKTLQQVLDGHGPLEVFDLVRIAEQIALGLAAAHARGLIHRDIKPSNILLEGGLNGCVKISDFGLARTADDATLTQSGTVAGTPLYMSPEQAQGQAIDHRSDLFSLGSVLYVMVSGRPPFRAATTVAVLKRVVEETPRPIAEIIPETPDWLCAIIAKLHAKSPDDRFQSAEEVGELLGQCLASLRANRPVQLPAGIPPAPRPVPAGAPTRTLITSRDVVAPRRRNSASGRRWPAVAALLIAVLVGLGLTEATGVTTLTSTIIRLTTSSGTLYIETDDPGISVTIDGEEVQIHGAGVQQLTLRPGSYRVAAVKDGRPVSQKVVTITRGGREVVRVTREGIAAEDEGVVPTAPVDGDDPDRRAAEWVLSLGGTALVRRSEMETEVRSARDLPIEAFQLAGIALDHNEKLKHAHLAPLSGLTHLRDLRFDGSPMSGSDWAPLASLTHLRSLNLQSTGISVDGVEHLQDLTEMEQLSLHDNPELGNDALKHLLGMKKLQHLDVRNTQVDDAGLRFLVPLQDLIGVALIGTQVTDRGLESLVALPKLSGLQLQHTAVTDAGLDLLSKRPSLRSIILNNTQVTESGVRRFATALPQCRVEWDGGVIEPRQSSESDRVAAEWALSVGAPVEISIAREKRTVNPGEPLPAEPFQLLYAELRGNPQVTDAGLDHFAGCRSLVSLHLSGDGVTDTGVAPFQECKQLISLGLENTAVTDAGLKNFEGCARLTSLVLNNSPVTDAGLAVFAACPELKHLQLSRTKVTDAGLAYFRDCRQLEEIVLGYTTITDTGLTSFRDCRSLRHLNLIDTDVTDTGMENFQRCQELEYLVLSQTHVTDAGLAVFRNCRRLVRLNLDHLAVTDRGLKPFYRCTGLTELTLFGAQFTDAGIGRFGQCTQLTCLLLDNTPLTNAGLQQFHDCQDLQLVHLDNTQVTDAGLGQFQDTEHLQQLTLANTAVGDAGLSSLSGLKELTWINLYGTGVTDGGLVALQSLTSLRELNLTRTSVTAAGVNGLHQSLPQCKIAWDGGTIDPQ